MSFVQYKRLRMLYQDYIINPIKAIQSFIGLDANILEYKENSVYMDGYVIVDVKFNSLDLNPCLLYWTQFKDCQKMTAQSENKFITQINGLNVCLNIRNSSELNPNLWIPFTISQALSEGGLRMPYKYYGIIKDTPFNYASTQIFTFSRTPENIDYDKCNVEKPLKNNKLDLMQYIKEYTTHFDTNITTLTMLNSSVPYIVSNEDDINEMVNSETAEIKKNVDKCIYPNNRTLFIFDIRKLKKFDSLTGVIFCIANRHKPWIACYYPNVNLKITYQKVEYLKNFMYNDYKNYLKWIERMEA